MAPTRVTAPVLPVVTLPELKAHLRVDGTEEDAMLLAYEAAAVSHLDGWRGVLGRCILSQQWAETYDQAGTFRLPFPDVSAVIASAGSATLSQDCHGPLVTITDPCTVTMTAAMPEDALNTVRMAVLLLVAHWFEHREAVSEVDLTTVPLAFEALISPLRWVSV